MSFLSFSSFFDEIKNAILNFGNISDVLDILLVAVLIYSAIKLIRETKAIQLLKGFVLILFIYILVNLFHMEASSYILSLVFSNLLIVLVVIFSPEIRHALESMGRSSVSKFSFFSKSIIEDSHEKEISIMINSVCKSCSELSDKKIGALIVFEKDSLLGDIIDTGTSVDCKMSPEIIGNIFFPKAPLHDGAMVIRDTRICAAGCILPLTPNTNISSSLGTRHSAAIGMSEQSDALVVVVSEEIGAISVAYKGNLKRNISDGDLREVLNEQFLPKKDDDNSKIKNIIRGLYKNENNSK